MPSPPAPATRYRRWIALLLATGVLSVHSQATSNSCPTVCNCKWKGGKQTVECVDRGLITIPTNVHPETQVLDMSGNSLQILPGDMFIRAGLLNLQKVYLRHCRIGQIDGNAFRGLTNLVELDLSHNLLTSIPSLTFHDTQFLRDVVLANNPIQKIESKAFGNLPNLVKLDLSNCELQTISTEAFEGVEQLASLKLNGNRLSELRQKTVESLSRLHGIDLHDNPWHCDCRLRATKLWLTNNNIPYTVAPQCQGGPKRVEGRTIAELDVEDFACRPEIRSQKRVVEASTGENATIECRVYATPPAAVHWYWNGRPLVNNSVFSTHQRVFIFEEGDFDRRNTLVLTNAQETDSSDFYCSAENRAGTADANFTLHVSLRAAGMSTLGSGQIAGLSAILVIVILFILLIILVLLVRLRRLPFPESKTPSQLETASNCTDNTANNSNCKSSSIGAGTVADPEHKVAPNDIKLTCNPVQKPPRLTELSYTTSHYEGNGSVINTTQNFSTPPPSSTATTNNPDLIKDTRRLVGGAAAGGSATSALLPASADAAAATKLTGGVGEESTAADAALVCGESVYPGAGGWEHPQTSSLNASPDLFIRRTTSTTAAGFNYDASDKTPIIGDGASLGGASEDETDYSCRTFPRAHHQHHNGYPPDYGLPIMPAGVDQKLREAGAVHGCGASPAATSPGAPASAKTIRVWQRGVPVLPPVTALKRVLSSSRNSPDEGYQEGCGTDV